MRIPRTFQQYLIVTVVVPLAAEGASRAADLLRARGTAPLAAQRLEQAGRALRRTSAPTRGTPFGTRLVDASGRRGRFPRAGR